MWDNPKNCVLKRHFFLSFKNRPKNSNVVKPQFMCGITTFFLDLKKENWKFFS